MGALIALLLIVIVLVMTPKPVPVEQATAVVAPFAQDVVNDGKSRIRERYTVSAPVAGTLARIALQEGDEVDPGTVLARLLPLPSPLLDPRERSVAQHRVASAEDAQRESQATLDRAQAAVEASERDHDRIKTLFSSAAVPKTQMDAAAADLRIRQTEAESARFAVKVAEHRVEEARAALETFSAKPHSGDSLSITSPVVGRVLHVLRKDEGVVNAGTALLELGDPGALEIVVDVLSQDASQLRAGMTARILHWGANAPELDAKVRRVEPAAFTRVSALGVEEQRVNVLLDLDSPRELWKTLGDGFAVEVNITVWSKPDALQVPTSALFRDDQGWALFVNENGRARRRRVTLGHQGPLATEVLAGVSPGEKVIIHPGATVLEGVRLQTRP
jgi:HlyD family secretion protein